jgi:hypothetical protein
VPCRVRYPWWPLVAITLFAGCGPTQSQIQGAILDYAPLFYLLNLVPIGFLCDVRQRSDPAVRFGDAGHVAIFALLVALAVWGGGYADFELVVLVLWFAGSLHLALFLLLWRVLVGRTPVHAPWIAGAAASIVTLAPAVAGLLGSGLGQFGVGVWLWGGLGGVLPVGLFVGFMIEAQRAARRSSEPPV